MRPVDGHSYLEFDVMTLAEAHRYLCIPLKFGDPQQVRAVRLIEDAISLTLADDLHICHECDGSSNHRDLLEIELCEVCDGAGVLDDIGDPHYGISVEVRMAAREVIRESERAAA
jgi:hypothetical protein